MSIIRHKAAVSSVGLQPAKKKHRVRKAATVVALTGASLVGTAASLFSHDVRQLTSGTTHGPNRSKPPLPELTGKDWEIGAGHSLRNVVPETATTLSLQEGLTDRFQNLYESDDVAPIGGRNFMFNQSNESAWSILHIEDMLGEQTVDTQTAISRIHDSLASRFPYSDLQDVFLNLVTSINIGKVNSIKDSNNHTLLENLQTISEQQFAAGIDPHTVLRDLLGELLFQNSFQGHYNDCGNEAVVTAWIVANPADYVRAVGELLSPQKEAKFYVGTKVKLHQDYLNIVNGHLTKSLPSNLMSLSMINQGMHHLFFRIGKDGVGGWSAGVGPFLISTKTYGATPPNMGERLLEQIFGKDFKTIMHPATVAKVPFFRDTLEQLDAATQSAVAAANAGHRDVLIGYSPVPIVHTGSLESEWHFLDLIGTESPSGNVIGHNPWGALTELSPEAMRPADKTTGSILSVTMPEDLYNQYKPKNG